MDTKLCEKLFKKDQESIINYFRTFLINGSIDTNNEIYYHSDLLIINTVDVLKLLDKDVVTFLDFFTIITNLNNDGRKKYISKLYQIKKDRSIETQFKIDYLVEYFRDYYDTDNHDIHTSVEWNKCFFVRYKFFTEFIRFYYN